MGSKKRHIILAALVLSLATAVYLNWQFSSNKELTSTDSIMSTKELGQAQFVNNSQKCEAKPENSEADKNNAEESKESSDYFNKAKTERQKARDEATESIKEILENAKSSEETKAEAVKKATEIAQKIEQESNIENLVRAKGFSECLAFLQNDECSLVVTGAELNESSAISIKDIVCGQAGISSDKIKIIEAKS